MIIPEHVNLGAIIPTLPIYASLTEEPKPSEKTAPYLPAERFEGLGATMVTLPVYASIDRPGKAVSRTFTVDRPYLFQGLGDESIF